MIKISLLSTFLLLLATVSCTQKQQELQWAPFVWAGSEMAGKYVEKAFIYVPVAIEGIPHKFNMQLDLGAINTNLYANAIDSYLEVYPDFKVKFDSTKTFWIQGEKNIMFTDVDLHLGSIPFKGIDVGYFSGFGDVVEKDSVYTATEKHVGTIAPDIFQDKVLLLDYKNARLAVADSLPEEFKNVQFIKFTMEYGRILIPFQIEGKTEHLMFDTGSSLFPLITSERKARAIAASAVIDSIVGESWGQTQIFYGLQVIKPILFAEKLLPNPIVYYDASNEFDEFFEEEDMWGITGNVFFLDKIIIIDYKNGLIGTI